MAHGNDKSTKIGDCIFILAILSPLLILFVNGRRVEFLKNKELLMHQGTVKTIKSEDGDVIDCVNINKQPAFNHPLLKNHTIQMKPHMHLRGIGSEDNHKIFFQNWLENGKCPEGTIPIIRKQEYVHRHHSYPADLDVFARHEYAQVGLVGGKFYGAHASLNVWNPATNEEEFSLAQIWVISGNDEDLNTLEAGWMARSGELKTRLFIFWTNDGYQTTGCYNLECPGFVQTNNVIALGSALEPLSTYGGEQFEIAITIQKDKESGNWWLQVQNQSLGYWPSSLFKALAESSTAINWGGEITNKLPQGHHTSTQMGSGHFSHEGYGKSSFFRHLGFIDESGTMRDPENLIPTVTNPSCYDLQVEDNKDNGVSFYFGGVGYSNKCP